MAKTKVVTMLCPHCGSKIRPNKGWAAMFYAGYCKTCDMPVESGIQEAKEIRCNPDVCPNCEYHGDGDSFCDLIGEFVLADWEPTEHYMGSGCPYRKVQKVKPIKKRRKKK